MLDRNTERGLTWHGTGSAVASADHRPTWEGYGGFRPEEEEKDSFDPLRLLFLVVQYRWLIAVLVAVALALGVVLTLMQSPKYQASSRIEIMVPTARVLEDMDVVAQSNDVRTFETARVKLKSRDLARRVVQQLNLTGNAAFLFPTPDFALQNIFSRVFGAPPKPLLETIPAERREVIAVNRVLSGLSIDSVRGTSLLEVSYRSSDPRQAAEIANQVVRSYMDQQVDRTLQTSDLARQFLDEQVAETKARLEQSEAALVAYSKEEGLSAAGDDGSLITANITAINASLADAIKKRLENQRLLDQINRGEGGQLQQVLDSEAIQATRSRLAGVRAEYQQKLSTFKPEFPEMVRLRAQMTELERQVASEVQVIASSIKLAHDGAVQEEADLRAKLRELENEQVAFRGKNIQYTILKREVESNRAQYQSLVDKRNELGVVSDVRTGNVDVVDLAIAPSTPYEPSLSKTLLIFLGGALGLSAAVIYILELLNNRFKVPDQIESELGLPVLGIIPKLENEKLSEALSNPRSALSEAYRSLRTSLQFSSPEGTPQTLLITSSEPGESKSTSAHKLAEEFAAVGNKVLLIDGDLRRPSLHRVLKVDNTLGLSNLLTNTVAQEDIDQLFYKTANPNLTFLATGPMVPNPADLLSSPRMASILRACSKIYEIIIIDGPPVIGLSDAVILSRLSESTLLVVAANQTARKAAHAALKRIRSAGGHVVGAMLGKLDVARIEYSYAYRYMYQGYYGYGDEVPKLTGKGSEAEQTSAPRTFGHVLAGVYRNGIRYLSKRRKSAA